MRNFLRELFIGLPQLLELAIVELFQIEQLVACGARHANELVELDLHGDGVSDLRILDHEHHQERDDRGRRVNDELPSVAKAE